MGKKKDKLLKKQLQQQQQQPVDYKLVDSDPVGFLVAPETQQVFFSKHWEKQPAVFRATPGRVALFQGLCSFPAFINWLKQREKKAGPLTFGVDLNAARYRDGVRTTPNGEVADAATLSELHNQEGCTLQLHQPQRFFDPCWRLLAALERQLGCLVGTNAYLTPAGSQGLAPHHDDVELWVVQTSGTKTWKLYEPIDNYHLPNAGSGDLDASCLGTPTMEVTLEVGDCLYMPRGTVHQAAASGGADSSHLTISTYQRCSYADLAMHLLQVGLSVQEEEPRSLPLAARFSPAPGTVLRHSLHHVLAQEPASTTPDAIGGLAGALRAIADKLEGPQGAGMMTAAVHSSAIDFLMNRLPPHPKQLPGKGRAPTLDDKVWCRVSGWCYLLPFEMTGMVCDDDSDGGIEDGLLKLVTCLANSREEHMIGQPEESEDEESGEEEEGSGSEEESDSGSEHDSGEPKAAGSSGSEHEEEAAGEANGHDAEGGGSHSGDDRHPHKDSKKGHKHGKKAAAGSEEEDCCGEDNCTHGSGADAQQSNPVAAMPGLVFEPKVAKTVVAFMKADTPDKAIAVRDLGLSSDAACLQFAFALWAEELAAVVPGSPGPQGGSKKEGKGQQAAGKRPHGSEAAEAAKAAAADGEQVATSSGKDRPAKKAKA